jgi:N-acetylneuraminic acid mutarotase
MGVALVEAYDISNQTNSILGNVSTRAFVQTGNNVMIGGFIVQGTGQKRVIVRAIGPELSAPPFNIPNALANPTLELHNGSGALIASNDDWQTTIIGGIITSNQVSAIQNSGHAPTQGSESAIIATLPAGNYTAIVRGVNSTTGIALVEVYDLTPTGTPTPTPTCTPACTPGTWMQAGALPLDVYGPGVDTDGTNIYSAGGYNFSFGGDLNALYRSTDGGVTWGVLASIPVPTTLPGFVYAPNVNKLFLFGGANNTTLTVYNTTRIYDIGTNTWSTGATMPGPRQQMAAGYYNGKIYVAAGDSTANPGSETNTIWEYDPVANTWNTSRANMPASLGGPGYGIINGHLYIAGGRNPASNNLNTLYDYDIAANTWTPRANLPTGVNAPGSTVICSKLWVFGGGNPFLGSGAMPESGKKKVQVPDTTNVLQIYNPATNTWSTGPGLNQQRSFPGGTHLGNTAVAIGGYTGTTTTNSVEINVTTGVCGP